MRRCTEDTVIGIYVELETEMRSSSLNFDKKKDKKVTSGKDPLLATYSNDEEGIIYTVDQAHDDVTAIEYIPAAKDCNEITKRKRAGNENPQQAHPFSHSHLALAWCREIIRNRETD